jgi:nucleoside-diphosphate-sugar epimerase
MSAITPQNGPVVVTGASGYVGSHVVTALMKRGYTVRACVTDTGNPDKTGHLLALNNGGHSGVLTLHEANLLEEGSYDDSFRECSALLHVGTAMGYGGKNNPRQLYDGAVSGTKNVLGSVKRAGSIKRVIYTSSFAAIGHPAAPGYVYTESDWASDDREGDPKWDREKIDEDRHMAYAMAKVDAERMANGIAEEDGRFDVISVCPLVVLGPLLSKVHDLGNSWQWFLGRMLAGEPCQRGWKHLWNIVDVRDVGASQVLMIESEVCENGSRYQLSASDETGELDVFQLQGHLQRLFPDIAVGGAPEEMAAMLAKHGSVYDSPRARCDKARAELGLETHAIEDTLLETGRTMIDLGLIEPALKG